MSIFHITHDEYLRYKNNDNINDGTQSDFVKDLLERLIFTRYARNITAEQIANKIGITIEEYENFELYENIISKTDLEKILHLILCSRKFLLGYSLYTLGDDSEALDANDYKEALLPHNFSGDRIKIICSDDYINKSKYNKHLTSSEIQGLDGTSNINYMKKYSQHFNCSWQYLAGLSFSRWGSDIMYCPPRTSPKNCSSSLISEFSNHYNNLSKEHKKSCSQHIGNRIRKRREEKNLSQSDIADLLGEVSHQAISKYENGQINIIDNLDLEKLSYHLSCSVAYLLCFTDNPIGLGVFCSTFVECINPIFTIEPYSFQSYRKAMSKIDEYDRNIQNHKLSELFIQISENASNPQKDFLIDFLKSYIKHHLSK